MIALDTDVFTSYLQGVPAIVAKIHAQPPGVWALPIVVVEEVMRGRLNAIRKLQSSKSASTLLDAYRAFQVSAVRCARYPILDYNQAADQLFQGWRKSKVRVGSQDMRIAAICKAHGIKLATGNRSDYQQLPNFDVEFWP